MTYFCTGGSYSGVRRRKIELWEVHSELVLVSLEVCRRALELKVTATRTGTPSETSSFTSYYNVYSTDTSAPIGSC
jgi:hypothetical protein